MRDEHLAILLSLADSYRSDVYLLNARLAAMEHSKVEELLDDALAAMTAETARAGAGSDLRVILSEISSARVAKRIELIREYHHSAIKIYTRWDADYPVLLKGTENPPLVLIVKGTVFPGNRPIAVVGTREAGLSGLEDSRLYSSVLARAGHTIVSGLARGVDTFAHLGALESGGSTLAILAGHVGHIWPPENHGLYDRIVESGSVISEVSPFGTVHKGRWVERNRITSGLSEGVIIAEFHGGGGTFHQAKFALSQGRPVFAIRRKTYSDPKAKVGVSLLTQMGAYIVETPEEVQSLLTVPNQSGSPKSPGRIVQTRLANQERSE